MISIQNLNTFESTLQNTIPLFGTKLKEKIKELMLPFNKYTQMKFLLNNNNPKDAINQKVSIWPVAFVGEILYVKTVK